MAFPCNTPPDTVSFLGGAGVGVGSGGFGGGGGGGGSSPLEVPPGTPPSAPPGTPPGTPCETATICFGATDVGSGIFSGGLVGGVKVVGAGIFLITAAGAGGGGAEGGGGGAIIAATSNASASPLLMCQIVHTPITSNPTMYIQLVTSMYAPVLVFS